MSVETDDEPAKRIFYTAHYHTMIAPTLFCDVNGEYRGMNDMIYTDPKKANYSTLSLSRRQTSFYIDRFARRKRVERL